MKTTSEIIALLKIFAKSKGRHYGIQRIGIFGSVARGEQQENSDVDVYVEGTLRGLFALSCIKIDLENLLGCKVDVVRLRDKMDDFLKKRILEEGIYV